MTKKISVGKRIVACACSVVMVGAFVPAASMAADGGADDTVLTVVATQVDENNQPTGITKTINYTADKLQSMVEPSTYNYLCAAKDSVKKFESNTVVTFSSFLGDISNNITDATISFTCADDPYIKYSYTYDDISNTKCYFPKYENNSESKIDTSDAVEVPSGIVLNATVGYVESGAIAADTIADENVDGVPMAVVGTEDKGDETELQLGKCFASYITTLNVTYQAPALTIYSQSAAEPGDPEVVRSFSSTELEAIATANQDHNFYQFTGKGGTSKIETEAGTYVTFSQLFAGLSCWKSDSTFSVGAGTDLNTKYTYTYKDITTKGYYFPNYVGGESSIDKTGAAEVPAALALSYKKGTIGDGEASSSVECADVTGNVVVMGAAADAAELLPGNHFWTNVDSIYITYKGNNTLKVSPSTKTFKVAKVKKAKKTFKIKATKAQGAVSYSVTKAAKKAGVSVSKAGKVTIKKGTKKDTYKVTVTAAGNDEYSAGSKTVKVKIVK